METIQYVNLTHRDKKEALDHLTQAAIGTHFGARLCTAELSFEEIVDNHRKGMTFRRLPVIGDTMAGTSMLILDLDNDPKNPDGTPDRQNPPPNLLQDELEEMLFMARLDGEITASTSGNPYKWHVFIRVPKTITSRDEYDRAVDDAERRLEIAFMELRGIKSSPVLRDRKLTVNTTIFAPCQQETSIVAIGNIRFDPSRGYYSDTPECHLLRTIAHPEPRYCKSSASTGNPCRDIPPRWSGLARLLHREGVLEREILEEPGADFGLASSIHFLRPGQTKETTKITVGNRDNRCYITTMALYGQARAYNLWMTQHGYADIKFTLEDMKWTLGKILRKSYEDDNRFTHAKFIGMLDNLDRQYGCWTYGWR